MADDYKNVMTLFREQEKYFTVTINCILESKEIKNLFSILFSCFNLKNTNTF